MEISLAGYYIYESGRSYLKSKEDERLPERVKEIFWFHGRKYGSRRVSDELKDEGSKAGLYRVRRLMREQNLWAVQPRRLRPKTTISDNRRASPNRLKEAFVSGPKGRACPRHHLSASCKCKVVLSGQPAGQGE